MKIGLATVNDSQHLLANRLAEQITSRSSGQMRPSVFPASQLGSNQRMIEGVQLGTLELVLGPPGFLASLNPGFQAVDAPAVFDDIAHAQRTATNVDFRTPYLELGSQSGVTGVLIYAATMFSYTFSQQVSGVADFRGKKIRVLGTRIEREIVSALGGTGVPMSFADAIPALQEWNRRRYPCGANRQYPAEAVRRCQVHVADQRSAGSYVWGCFETVD